jgi:uncharacterized phage protein gp47/JayE
MIQIPTLSELRTQVQTNLETEFGTTLPTFGKNFLRVISIVWASILWLLYKYLGFIQKNTFVDTADSESVGGTLERWGRAKLGRNLFQAVAAQYVVNVTGTIGATIAVNTVFKSADDSTSPGKLFILDSNFELESSPDQITLRAIEAGVDSRLSVSDELNATIPLTNVNQVGTVASELVAPQAAETTEEYRTKIEESLRLEANGGSTSDYRLWAADVQGVAKVYPYVKSGFPGEINLFVEATIADSTDGKGTPSQGMLDDVAEVIELDPDTTLDIEERGRRPMGVHQVHTLPVLIQEIDITIDGLSAIPSDEKDLIEEALIEMIDEVRPFIAAADLLTDKNDILDVNKIISQILATRPGSSFGTVVLNVNGSPVSTVTFINGQIPWVDTITFI